MSIDKQERQKHRMNMSLKFLRFLDFFIVEFICKKKPTDIVVTIIQHALVVLLISGQPGLKAAVMSLNKSMYLTPKTDSWIELINKTITQSGFY